MSGGQFLGFICYDDINQSGFAWVLKIRSCRSMIRVIFSESQNALNYFDTDDNQSQFKSHSNKSSF